MEETNMTENKLAENHSIDYNSMENNSMENNFMENNSIDYKAYGKTFSRLGLGVFAGYIVAMVAQLVIFGIVGFINPMILQNGAIYQILALLPVDFIALPVIYLILKSIPTRVPGKRSMSKGQFLVAAIMTYAIMYLSNIIGNIFTIIIGLMKGGAVDNAVLNFVTGSNVWVTFLLMVIVAPIAEELLFRKVICDRLLVFGEGMTVLFSGLLFGLFHGNLNQFVYAFTLGAFLAFLYVKTGNVKITIALHMLVNFMGSVVATWLMDMINYEEYMELISYGPDLDALMQYFSANMAGWVIYILYFLLLVVLVVTGGILLIVFRKRFCLEAGEITIPKGKRFRTTFLNVGMILFVALEAVMIIIQLLQ